MMNRVDRALSWLTPVLIIAVLLVSLVLLTVTQRELQAQTQRAEARTERLVEMLMESREAVDRIEARLCEADPGCIPP